MKLLLNIIHWIAAIVSIFSGVTLVWTFMFGTYPGTQIKLFVIFAISFIVAIITEIKLNRI